MNEIYEKIINICLNHTSINPIEIFHDIVSQDYIRIHGPEHHIIDGACILTAYANASYSPLLKDWLIELVKRGSMMPGAMCGLWGVCGAVTSVGAALSIIDNTGPLSIDGTWGHHMEYTSKTTQKLGEINGPRCCKRDGFIALEEGIEFINKYYNVKLEKSDIHCVYSFKNTQCIGQRCPFH